MRWPRLAPGPPVSPSVLGESPAARDCRGAKRKAGERGQRACGEAVHASDTKPYHETGRKRGRAYIDFRAEQDRWLAGKNVPHDAAGAGI